MFSLSCVDQRGKYGRQTRVCTWNVPLSMGEKLNTITFLQFSLVKGYFTTYSSEIKTKILDKFSLQCTGSHWFPVQYELLLDRVRPRVLKCPKHSVPQKPRCPPARPASELNPLRSMRFVSSGGHGMYVI